MKTRKWNNNITTSLLGFGVMRVKTNNGIIDEEKAMQLIDYAYQNGVNYFDTAMPYTNGLNEAFLGKALKKYPRDSLYIATKLSLGVVNSKEEMLTIIDKQLENLQTDYIDFYLLHALNKDRFKTLVEWGVFEHLENIKSQGKIRHIGFSFHDDLETFKTIIDYYSWDFCQIQLNYMDINIQQGLEGYHYAHNKNIPVVVMEPVKGGKLSKFNEQIEQIFKSYNKDASISSWALRWVGSLEGVKVVLSGMNELDQVVDNIKTFADFKPLDDQEQTIVNNVRSSLLEIANVPCTRCRYCMPCTVGVNIPSNFNLINNYSMYQDKGEALYMYKEFIKNQTDAGRCVNCKKCVEKCPQQINIPSELLKVKEKMEKLIKEE